MRSVPGRAGNIPRHLHGPVSQNAGRARLVVPPVRRHLEPVQKRCGRAHHDKPQEHEHWPDPMCLGQGPSEEAGTHEKADPRAAAVQWPVTIPPRFVEAKEPPSRSMPSVACFRLGHGYRLALGRLTIQRPGPRSPDRRDRTRCHRSPAQALREHMLGTGAAVALGASSSRRVVDVVRPSGAVQRAG
jgi:hypothetical protein